MARLRPYALALVAVALTHAAGWSDTPRSSPVQEPEIIRSAPDAPVSRFYSLADLGDDPAFAKWVVQTLQTVVQPGTWGRDGCTFSYYAPKKLLVVCHCPTAHDEVTRFLSDMRSSLANGKEKAHRHHGVSPAQYQEPAVVKTADTTPSNNYGYPVPTQAKQPKHLFHFIIRYEGEGIIDSNVADLFKQIYGAATKESMEKDDVILPGTILPSVPAGAKIAPPNGTTLKWSTSDGPAVVAPTLPSPKATKPSDDESDPATPEKYEQIRTAPKKVDSDTSGTFPTLPSIPSTERQSKSRNATPPYSVPAPLSYPRTLRRN